MVGGVEETQRGWGLERGNDERRFVLFMSTSTSLRSHLCRRGARSGNDENSNKT